MPDAGVTLLQEDNETLRIGAERYAEHAAGWIDVHDASHGVALASRFFWQEYPQSFELRPNGLTYNLWPPAVPPAKVGMGVAKTHEFILYFHGKAVPAPGLLAAFGEPLLGRVNGALDGGHGSVAERHRTRRVDRRLFARSRHRLPRLPGARSGGTLG